MGALATHARMLEATSVDPETLYRRAEHAAQAEVDAVKAIIATSTVLPDRFDPLAFQRERG